MNQNPEQLARDTIDRMLLAAGLQVQSKQKINGSAGMGVAVEEIIAHDKTSLDITRL